MGEPYCCTDLLSDDHRVNEKRSTEMSIIRKGKICKNVGSLSKKKKMIQIREICSVRCWVETACGPIEHEQ